MSLRARTVLTILITLCMSQTLFGGGFPKPSLDSRLARDMMMIEQYRADPSARNANRLKQFNLPIDLDPTLKVVFYFGIAPTTDLIGSLKASGIVLFPESYIPQIGSHPYSFVIGEVSSSRLKALTTESGVFRMASASRELKPLNDITAIETGVAEARQLPTPLRGAGVRVAVLDSGFRPGLPDLPAAIEAMDYSEYPDTNTDVSDIASGHGTHVAGTVFGNGSQSNGRWMGMAPDCDPIYLKIGDDSTSDASTAAVVGAIKAAATWCDADILTMSYGGFDGYNDGSSPEEQTVDWAVGQGVTAFMSAGNSANEFNHASGMLQPGQRTVPYQAILRFAPDSVTAGFVLSWYDSPDTTVHRQLSAFVLNGRGDTLELDSPGRTTSLRGTESIEYVLHEPLRTDSTSVFIYVQNHSNTSQHFHLQIYSTHWFFRFVNYDRGYTVLVPSTADSCISVGAYTGRSQWTDYLGTAHDDGVATGSIAYFSSIGPRIDGRLKPNITAPGKRTISCRDTATVILGRELDYVTISNEGDSGTPADYLALMGTSMSSPAAAGTAALMIEAHPGITPAELRQLIYASARTDEFTGQTPNATWGWGKIDLMQALDVDFDQPNPSVESPLVFGLVSVYPNPYNSLAIVSYELLRPGKVTLRVFDLGGRQVWEANYHHQMAGQYQAKLPADLMGASGVSWLELGFENSKRIVRLVNLR